MLNNKDKFIMFTGPTYRAVAISKLTQAILGPEE